MADGVGTEDHVGRPFFGISDNYTQATPATFGRRELRRILGRVGFTKRDFYLPFPDYKLPSVVISPLGAASRGFDAGVLAAETVHSEPQPFPDPAFALQKAWPIVARNGLLRELESFDEEAARVMGLHEGQITVLIHSGSRGLGYQVCEDNLAAFSGAPKRYGFELPDRQLACAPVRSPDEPPSERL